jgi:hypothetical protein
MLSVEISPEPPEPPQYPSLFVAGLATGQITAEYASILLFFFFRREHTSASVRAAMEETRGTFSEKGFSILLVWL